MATGTDNFDLTVTLEFYSQDGFRLLQIDDVDITVDPNTDEDGYHPIVTSMYFQGERYVWSKDGVRSTEKKHYEINHKVEPELFAFLSAGVDMDYVREKLDEDHAEREGFGRGYGRRRQRDPDDARDAMLDRKYDEDR